MEEKRFDTKFVFLNLKLANLNHPLFFQEENALLAEMEFTGQAFEEMQEQNIRLMQQLREKDDANLKLMSEVCENIQDILFEGSFEIL